MYLVQPEQMKENVKKRMKNQNANEQQLLTEIDKVN